MEAAHQVWRGLHIGFGFLALLTFWMAALARKGSGFHRRSGMLFYFSTWIVSLTAIGSSLWALVSPDTYIGPLRASENALEFQEKIARVRFVLALLGTLAWNTLAVLVVGCHVVQAQRHARPWRWRPVLLLLEIGQLVSAAFTLYGVFMLVRGLYIWGAIALAIGIFTFCSHRTDWAYLLATEHSPRNWWKKHIEGMISAGVAVHTAFFVFGSRFFGGTLFQNSWQVITWILPAIVGSFFISWWTRRFNQQDLPNKLK